MDLCLYTPVWNPERPAGAPPVFILAGPFLEVNFGYLKFAFTNIYKDLDLPYGMKINDALFDHVFASENGRNYLYFGKLVPPTTENQNNATNLATINTNLFQGGRRKLGKTRRQQKRMKRRGSRRTK